MHIAICDNEILDIKVLETYLLTFNSNIPLSYFLSTTQLLNEIFNQKHFFDLIFLDIEMDHSNGFVTAQYLMRHCIKKPLIVFVTKSSKYSTRGYGIAFRYLVKPITYNELYATLLHALPIISPRKFKISYRGENTYIPISDIQYFEVCDVITTIHTSKRITTFRMPLRKIEQSLPPLEFSRPHNSFLVHLNQVKILSHCYLVLLNNSKLPLSRSCKTKFCMDLHRYLSIA